MRNPIFALVMSMCMLASPSAHAAEQAKERSAWILVSSAPKELEGTQMQIAEGDLQPVPNNIRSVIGPIRFSGEGLLRITSGKAVDVLFELKLPETSQKTLIILVPTVSKEEGLHFSAIIHDMSKFTAGTWLFVNQADAEFRVRLDESQIELKRGEHRIMKASDQVAQAVKTLGFDTRGHDGEEWSLMSTSKVSVLSSRREILFFTDDPLSGEPTYHGVTLSE